MHEGLTVLAALLAEQPRVAPVALVDGERPGGGLAAHELAGHTILRHVSRAEDQLRARLNAKPSLDFASTYLDRETAEAAISEAIDMNEVGIARWLQTNDAKLAFDHTYDEPIGVTLPREARGPVVVSRLRVVLRVLAIRLATES